MSTSTSSNLQNQSAISPQVFVCVSAFTVVVLVLYPWILGVSITFFLIGFYCIDYIDIPALIKSFIGNDAAGEVSERKIFWIKGKQRTTIPPETLIASDPLLNTVKQNLELENEQKNSPKSPKKFIEHETGVASRQGSEKRRKNCDRCDKPNSPNFSQESVESLEKGDGGLIEETTGIGGSIHNSPVKYYAALSPGFVRGDHDLKIDPRLDIALARFCNSVFNFYISPEWAPYESRKQLKVAFKKLLTTFAEKVNNKIIQSNEKGSAEPFCREKLLPILLYYFQQQKGNHYLSDEDEKHLLLKVRCLCKKVLKQNLCQEDQKCRVWLELCVSVLADGVLWNLILLGREELPELLLQCVQQYKLDYKNSNCKPEEQKQSVSATISHPLSDSAFVAEIVVSEDKGTQQKLSQGGSLAIEKPSDTNLSARSTPKDRSPSPARSRTPVV